MGLIVRGDIETNQGPTEELYIRIDNWKINMATNAIRFSTTAWLNKEFGDKFLRKHFDDELKPAIALVSGKIVYYDDKNKDGLEVEIPNLYDTNIFSVEEVEEDVLEVQSVTKEVPYVSFDEEGNEITLFKTVTSKENVKVGVQVVEKKVIDYSIPLNSLGEFSYNHLKNEIQKLLPDSVIEKV